MCLCVCLCVLFRDFDVLRFSFWSFSFSDETGQGRVGGIQEGVFLCEVGGVWSLLWLYHDLNRRTLERVLFYLSLSVSDSPFLFLLILFEVSRGSVVLKVLKLSCLTRA